MHFIIYNVGFTEGAWYAMQPNPLINATVPVPFISYFNDLALRLAPVIHSRDYSFCVKKSRLFC